MVNIDKILMGIQNREIRTPRDFSRATLGQLVNTDIPVPSVAIRVLAFKHFEVQGWGRDALNPTGEIGGYTSREDIS